MTSAAPTSADLYLRQHAILDPSVAANTHVTICGVGTVGSNVAVQMARAGIGSFELCDMDVVEAHNIPSQAFSLPTLGMEKVDACTAMMNDVSPSLAVVATGELSGYEAFERGPVVLAVDNMEMRKQLFETCATNPAVELVMDFRMGGWQLQAWCINLNDKEQVEKYRKTLYSSGEVVQATCGTRTFAPVGALSGGLATCLLTLHLGGNPVPFYTSLDMQAMTMFTAGMKDAE